MHLQLILLLSLLACGSAHAQSRAEALKKMEIVMGPLPVLDRNFDLHVEMGEQQDAGTYTRTRLTYRPETGRTVFAWLLVPKAGRRGPAALCLHQTTRIGKDEPIGRGPKPNLHYAMELAERGWVALAPDYPSFGEDQTNFEREVYGRGYRSGTMYGIVNHIRAIDLLERHPRVDPRRIAVIGHSLGGHNSLFVAAFDPRIRVTVTSCGFTSFAKYYGGNLKGWTSPRYMPLINDVYGNDPKKVPFDFTDVLAAIAPRALFVNAPLRDSNFEVSGVRDVIAAVSKRFPKGRLQVEYPDAEHDFPPANRRQAYEFMERLVR